MKVKRQLYNAVLRTQEDHITEMKMLRWGSRQDQENILINETNRGNAKVTPINSVTRS